jgi:hypothetical protein
VAADVRERTRPQIDVLVRLIAGDVQRVIAGTVPDAGDESILGGVERVLIPLGIGVEAVGVVFFACLMIGAVLFLDGGDV